MRARRRLLALGGVAGGLLGLAAPLLLRWRYGAPEPPGWLQAAMGRLPWPAGGDDWTRLGEWLAVVYLLTLCAVLAAGPGRPGRPGRHGFVLLVAGLAAGAAGNLGSYLTSDMAADPAPWQAVAGLGWFLEPPALAAVLAGSVLYGVGVLRSGGLPRWCGWALVAAGPAGVVNTVAVMASYPRGTLLPVSLAWAAIALRLLPAGAGEPRLPAPPAASRAG